MTIEELQEQRRWVNWKLEVVNGKATKVPYQPNGRKAQANNPATWNTYADCAAVMSKFSGVGLALGNGVFGVDIDKCCDALTGKFTAESREIVIGLDSYGEFSPSGTGCHVFGLGTLPGDGKAIVRPIPGAKQIEIKALGYYFTFSARHLNKTPADLMPRQSQLEALCKQVLALPQLSKPSVGVVVSGNEEEKYKRLMAGDISDYDDNHSRADLALCGMLARKFNNDIFRMDEAFRESGLYRDKWDRSDYRSATLLKACKGEPIFEDSEEPIEDDGIDEYLVESLGVGHEGWFPKGDVSVVGGSSGSGKSYWALTLLEKIRKGEDAWGHKTKPRDYRVLLNDRGAKGTRRTIQALGLSQEAKERVIRLTSAQHKRSPAEILEACCERHPGAEAWFLEGLDLWITNPNDMAVVAPVLDGLQRLAARRNVAIIGSVGAPKQKGQEKDKYYGRDSLFGSAAFGRKVETVVLISPTDADDANSVRQYSVLPRNGRAERFWMAWTPDGLVIVDKPADKETESKAFGLMKLNVFGTFKVGEVVTYLESLGPKTTFYRWREVAAAAGLLTKSGEKYYRSHAVQK